jgi:hypothetical protein
MRPFLIPCSSAHKKLLRASRCDKSESKNRQSTQAQEAQKYIHFQEKTWLNLHAGVGIANYAAAVFICQLEKRREARYSACCLHERLR